MRWIAIVLTLMLASLACQVVGSGGGAETVVETLQPKVPTVEEITVVSTIPVIEPTATPPATETPDSETSTGTLPALPPAQPGPETLDLGSLPKEPLLYDYKESYQVSIQFTDNDDLEQNFTTVYEYRLQTVPVSGWRLFYDDQNPFFASQVEAVVMGEQAYSAATDVGCERVQSDQITQEDQRLAFRSLLEALSGQVTRTQSDVPMGDLTVDVYPLTVDNLDAETEIVMKAVYASADGDSKSTVSTTIDLVEEDSQLVSATLYLAQQGGFVARIELVYGKVVDEEDAMLAKLGTEMTRTVVYNMQPVTSADGALVPPADCGAASDDGGGMGGGTGGSSGAQTIADIPRLEDASNSFSTSDTLFYQSSASVSDVVAFYKEQLSALGWVLDDEFSMDAMATLEFTHGGQTLTISILSSGGVTTVSIDLS
jgi:hypothetical protein